MTDEDKYWYNLKTGQVERGFESPSADRAGPFDTEAEAAAAPELIAQRSRAWAEEEAREDEWGSGSAGDVSPDGEDGPGR